MTKTTEKNHENDDLAYRRPRPMSKGELAQLYAPNLKQGSAVNRLMKWMHMQPELMSRLHQCGYNPRLRIFTVRQVELIFEYLGEP